MRQIFAKRVHELLGRDLMKTQLAPGHWNVGAAVSYFSFLQEEIESAVLA